MRRPVLLAIALLAVTGLSSLAARTPWPVDETRYLAVAWEMWSGGEWLVPRLNGEPYTHKPPLLFWAMHAGWAVLGVNSWWPRLLPLLFGILAILGTARLARRLWPEAPSIGGTAALVLGGSFLFAAWSTLIMFDLIIVAASTMAMLALISATRGGGARAWLGLGAALGLGLLAKGPVVLVHVLPAALLAPLWARDPRPARWAGHYLGVLASLALGLGLVLAWALPAARAGGEAYGDAILWGQTVSRLDSNSVHMHMQPWWWYLARLPLLLYPWLLWPALWRGAARLRGRPGDDGLRLAAVWALGTLLAMTIVPAKQEQYLLPAFPAFALLAARALAAAPARAGRFQGSLLAAGPIFCGAILLVASAGWLPVDDPIVDQVSPIAGAVLMLIGAGLAIARLGRGEAGTPLIAVATTACLVAGLFGVAPAWQERHDMRPAGQAVAAFRAEGRPVAALHRSEGKLIFAGRLTEPIEFVWPLDLPRWVAAHPLGVVFSDDGSFVSGDPTPSLGFASGEEFWYASDLAARFAEGATPIDPFSSGRRR